MPRAARNSRTALVGGRPCLDFVNTARGQGERPGGEALADYRALATWGQAAGLLGRDEARQLAEAASRRPSTAAAALDDALALRAALAGLFGSLAGGGRPAARDLQNLDDRLFRAPARRAVVPEGKSFGWSGSAAGENLDRVVWQVAWSAADLLTGGPLERIRRCEAEGCDLLFLDESRAGARRWCSMTTCGNRAKARRHYQRQKEDG